MCTIPTATRLVLPGRCLSCHPLRPIYALSLYPSFGHISGVIDTWASDFYSPELNNSREIIIFKPNSFVQNWLSRVMNVIIVNDGMIDVVNGYVINGGLDTGNWPVRIQTCIIQMID